MEDILEHGSNLHFDIPLTFIIWMVKGGHAVGKESAAEEEDEAAAAAAVAAAAARLQRTHLQEALAALQRVFDVHAKLATLMASRSALAPLLACIAPVCR